MEGKEDPEIGSVSKRGRNVSTMLANDEEVTSAWGNFMGKFFKSSFDLDELDPVLAHLKSLSLHKESISQDNTNEEGEDGMSQNMNKMEDELSQLEKKVFGNHLLSKAIFSHLSIKYLLPCRLVNTVWNKTVNEILGKQLVFNFSSISSRFYFGPGKKEFEPSNWKNLDMFTELFKSSSFPCSKFAFYKGNLENDDARRFFSRFGPSISYLKIDSSRNRFSMCDCEDGYDSDDVSDDEEDKDYDTRGFSSTPTTLVAIGNILTKKTVNIKELVLKIEISSDFYMEKFKGDLNLPHLTSLTFQCKKEDGQTMLLSLLKGAENLKTIEIGDEYSNEMLLMLPKFCQEIVVKIGTFRNFNFDSSVQLPVFKNVQHISLKAAKDQGSFFPPGSSLSATFPKLNSLSIEFLLGAQASESWRALFPTAENISTVQTITIRNARMCPLDSEKLLEMFPNLEKIVVFECQSLFPFSLVIWKFHKFLHLLQLGENFCRPWSHFPVLNRNSSIALDGQLMASSSDLEFIWQNVIRNNSCPVIVERRGYWRLTTLKPSCFRICSKTRYLFNDSSTLTLAELLHSRGMTWEDALAKHAQIKGEDEGFYMETHEIKGVKGKNKNKVVKTVKTVQLFVKQQGDSLFGRETVYSTYNPSTGECRFSQRPGSKKKKLSPQEAKTLWQKEYTSTGFPKLQCEHLYRQGKCPCEGTGWQCKTGVRELTYFVLSGAVLKASHRVIKGLPLSKIDYSVNPIRIQDDIDPIMGIEINESAVRNLKQNLSAAAASVEEQ